MIKKYDATFVNINSANSRPEKTPFSFKILHGYDFIGYNNLVYSSGCMLGGQPNHGWQLCFLLSLHDLGSDFRLYDGSNLKTYLLMR